MLTSHPCSFCTSMTTLTPAGTKQIALATVSYPAYLFDEEVVGNYDPNNPSNGAYRSITLRKVSSITNM